MERKSKIYVAGHNGMVGSSIMEELRNEGYDNLIYRSSSELDLRDQAAVQEFFTNETPEYVFLSAAKVGGIGANSNYKADFIYDNIMIQTNVIHQSFLQSIKKLLFLGSSCIYPKYATQPISEDALLTGKLEPTNESYAISKILGIKMCDSFREQYGCDFISAMPTNLYGPNDHYDLENSHVIPALFRKFIEAKRNNLPHITIWGTGTPKREFMHVKDMAKAAIFLMQNYSDKGPINVGTGIDITILDLARLLKKITEYSGKLIQDRSKPDGMPRKLLDVSNINGLGWNYRTELEIGLRQVYEEIKHQVFT